LNCDAIDCCSVVGFCTQMLCSPPLHLNHSSMGSRVPEHSSVFTLRWARAFQNVLHSSLFMITERARSRTFHALHSSCSRTSTLTSSAPSRLLTALITQSQPPHTSNSRRPHRTQQQTIATRIRYSHSNDQNVERSIIRTCNRLSVPACISIWTHVLFLSCFI